MKREDIDLESLQFNLEHAVYLLANQEECFFDLPQLIICLKFCFEQIRNLKDEKPNL